MTRWSCWALKMSKNLIWGPSYGLLKKCSPESDFFRVATFKQLLQHQILIKSKNLKNQHIAKSLRLWNFRKISFLAWYTDNTVLWQILSLFDGFFRYSLLFLVFTSIMNFFLLFPFKPPSFFCLSCLHFRQCWCDDIEFRYKGIWIHQYLSMTDWNGMNLRKQLVATEMVYYSCLKVI